jgi:alpha-D-ribose 1-methylphosphonate 5-triphosphate diphosphatase PhnM
MSNPCVVIISHFPHHPGMKKFRKLSDFFLTSTPRGMNSPNRNKSKILQIKKKRKKKKKKKKKKLKKEEKKKEKKQ